MGSLVKRIGHAVQRFDGHGCGDVGVLDQVLRIVDAERGDARHERGAVVKRKTFLRHQVDRLQASFLNCLGSRHLLAFIIDVADTEHGNSEM